MNPVPAAKAVPDQPLAQIGGTASILSTGTSIAEPAPCRLPLLTADDRVPLSEDLAVDIRLKIERRSGQHVAGTYVYYLFEVGLGAAVQDLARRPDVSVRFRRTGLVRDLRFLRENEGGLFEFTKAPDSKTSLDDVLALGGRKGDRDGEFVFELKKLRSYSLQLIQVVPERPDGTDEMVSPIKHAAPCSIA